MDTLQIASGATKGGLRKWDGIKQKLLILNQFFFGCRGIGLGQTRRVSIRLERSSERRGTVLFGGLTLR